MREEYDDTLFLRLMLSFIFKLMKRVRLNSASQFPEHGDQTTGCSVLLLNELSRIETGRVQMKWPSRCQVAVFVCH